jgi:hypothetical protein
MLCGGFTADLKKFSLGVNTTQTSATSNHKPHFSMLFEERSTRMIRGCVEPNRNEKAVSDEKC